MDKRADEELIKIVTVERTSYNPIAIEAADAESKKQNIDKSEFEEINEQIIVEKQQIEKVDSNIVGSGIRFVNFLINFIVWLIIAFIVSFIIGIFVQPAEQRLLTLFGYVLIFGTHIAYYAIMEIKFQKTVGKFVTKTKVVTMNGEKPTDGDIIARTFCRLISFDRLSFPFVKNGIRSTFKANKKITSVSNAYVEALKQHRWNGNIRALKNVIERIVVLGDDELTIEHLPIKLQKTTGLSEKSKTLSAFSMLSTEELHIQKILNHTGGSKAEATRLSKIGAAKLHENR